jgi:hypothetical protein
MGGQKQCGTMKGNEAAECNKLISARKFLRFQIDWGWWQTRWPTSDILIQPAIVKYGDLQHLTVYGPYRTRRVGWPNGTSRLQLVDRSAVASYMASEDHCFEPRSLQFWFSFSTISQCLNSLKQIITIRKVKRKFRPITGHEGTEGEYRYSDTSSLTSALGGGFSTPRPSRFTPRKENRLPFYRGLGGLFWKCAENLASTNIRWPDRVTFAQWVQYI